MIWTDLVAGALQAGPREQKIALVAASALFAALAFGLAFGAPKFAHFCAQAPNLGVKSDLQQPTTTDRQPLGTGADEPKSL